MTLSPREKELIDHYRAASEHARQQISIITQEAAEVARRLTTKQGGVR